MNQDDDIDLYGGDRFGILDRYEGFWDPRLPFSDKDWNTLISLLPRKTLIRPRFRYAIEKSAYYLTRNQRLLSIEERIKSYKSILALTARLRDAILFVTDDEVEGELEEDGFQTSYILEWSELFLNKYGKDLEYPKSEPRTRRRHNAPDLVLLLQKLIKLWEHRDGKLAFSTRFDPKSGKQQLSGPLARFLKAGLTPLYAAAKRRMPSDTQLIYLLRKMRRERKR